MKKHLRLVTAAFAAMSLALVGCEADDDGLVDDDAPDAEEPADDLEGEDEGDDLDLDDEGDDDLEDEDAES